MALRDQIEDLRDGIDEIATFAHAGPRRLLDEALSLLDQLEDRLARAEAAADHADAFQDSLSA